MLSGSYRYFSLVGILAGALSMQSACGSEVDSTVSGRVVVVGNTTRALTLVELVSANGTYLTCRGHADGSAWRALITAGGTAPDDPLTMVEQLTVAEGDTACALTLTALVIDGSPDVILTATPPIPLVAGFAATASEFGSGASLFYANAQINPTTFLADFVINIIFSNTPVPVDRAVMAGLDAQEFTVTAAAVPAPAWVLDETGLILMTDFDDIVTSFTGSASLTDPAMEAGQTYVLVQGAVTATYEAIETAFNAGTPAGEPTTIAAATFTIMVGDDFTGMPRVRTLIIANTVEDVTSYQVFVITFSAFS